MALRYVLHSIWTVILLADMIAAGDINVSAAYLKALTSLRFVQQLTAADNQAFQVDWCAQNPELLAMAYFDSTIGIHTLQLPNDSVESHAPVPTPKPDGSDVFDVSGFSQTMQPTSPLKQLPK